jgi:putative Ca2+/H+ antiporter (TMEM165/GDT1 family)
VFVAEPGDKSQLMALTFATRYRALPVLVGITLATAVVHAVSVAIGYGLGAALPTGWIALVAAVAFVGFGAWTLRGDALTDDEREKAERSTGWAVVAASVAFFLAELGDPAVGGGAGPRAVLRGDAAWARRAAARRHRRRAADRPV